MMKRTARMQRILFVMAAASATSAAFTSVRHQSSMPTGSPRSTSSYQSTQALEFDPLRRRRQLNSQPPRQRRQYQRKSIPQSEREARRIRKNRQAQFEEIKQLEATIWSFESLFPDPVWDETSIETDLFAVKKRDSVTKNRQKQIVESAASVNGSNKGATGTATATATSKVASAVLQFVDQVDAQVKPPVIGKQQQPKQLKSPKPPKKDDEKPRGVLEPTAASNATATAKVDRDLTRMVRDRIYGYRRTRNGNLQYDTSLLGQGKAIQFREGVRLGNPLKVNADRLNYLARKELSHGKVEEAQELYELALEIDPRDGRAYLGMNRCAQRRRDFKRAGAWLSAGISNSVAPHEDENVPIDRGANPFLLQALGVLEERMGHLAQAEALYIDAVKSRPSHAAAWVSLGQLRTRKLGQPASAGRLCFQSAQHELLKYDLKVPAHVYTAWASLEASCGDTRKARELYAQALEVDDRSSVAWLQLGALETKAENWEEAQRCFESGLKNDRRNSRILQAYALMETKRPDSDSRKAIGFFERALKAKPRDAGVCQAYALYVQNLGDIDAARELMQRGTKSDKRHAPVWQAWGVLETRHGYAETARSIFQEGIWSCAESTGCRSGGYRCARLWQAWGVLEAQEGEAAAARRCFSRALDADGRNVAAVTAWARMEEDLENVQDARAIFERALSQFTAGSSEKNDIWRTYELMEQRLANVEAAQYVYQRRMRETMQTDMPTSSSSETIKRPKVSKEVPKQRSADQVEFSRWESDATNMGAEVWLNERAIESKIPKHKMKSSPNGSNNKH